ncbi:hypothetical protein SAMN04487936_10960 [Halobacillus dabanensis]|uniref:PAS domain-containing protein n=1 Tax=Halobacillus dabanensis TaxID=240302 RepID=A0A1I3XQ84_HALDA|nr:hypothetical protein [Halobacillus dabanensis]SFK21221.1 hypothetical protein SAMN04487936_10960 [Halobacillus dabanensis]
MDIKAHIFTKYWIDFMRDRNGEEADHLAFSPFSHLSSYKELMKVLPFFVIDSSETVVYTNKRFRDLIEDMGDQMHSHSLESPILHIDPLLMVKKISMNMNCASQLMKKSQSG